MEHKLYGFNSSQDIINLQTKYSLFARVSNIVIATVVEDGFDRSLMTTAINKLFERNDCLRITFVKKEKKIMQYFEESRTIGKIKEYVFETAAQQNSFVRSFRRRALNCFKGETLKVVFATNPDGKDMILYKISHYVADQYGIGVLVNDLFSVYEALKNGSELPAAPGSFEEVLKKDLEYKDNTESVEKDKAFFQEYYEGKEHPVYCGIHGNNSERWHKLKKKGNFSLPYLFVKCDTTGYKLTIPAALSEKAFAWCEENKITPSAFFFNVFCITASLANNKEKIQAPLMLLDCRGTMAERKAAGTKVQSLSIYVKVDYDKSFNENIAEEYAAQNQLFRHTKLTYLEVEALQHKLWGHSMLSQITNFCYSFIPFSTPKGVTMQVLSNGKGALATYVALMLKEASGNDMILQKKEFPRWSKANQATVSDWVKDLPQQGAANIRDKGMLKKGEYTPEGQLNARRAFGFKKYLTDFTLIAERGSSELPLWQDYLIYGALYGIADKIAKELKDIDPKAFEETFGYDYPTLHRVLYLSNNMSSSIMSAVVREQNAHSTSGHGGFSSFGGGGGFHGGGFGGGVR